MPHRDALIQKHRARVVGRQDAPRTVVLAHGFGSDQTAWDAVAADLGADHRVVLFDHAGSGRVSSPEHFSAEQYPDLDAYADDVLQLCNALSLDRVVFVGHSMSGNVGVLASLRRPDLFHRLVLLGSSPRYLDDGDYQGGFDAKALDALIDAMGRDYQAWVSGFAPAATGAPSGSPVADRFAGALRALRPDVAQAVLRMVLGGDLRREYARVSVPTLVIQTREDIVVPVGVGEIMTRLLPESRLEVIETRGHFPHMTEPGKVAAAIRGWA